MLDTKSEHKCPLAFQCGLRKVKGHFFLFPGGALFYCLLSEKMGSRIGRPTYLAYHSKQPPVNTPLPSSDWILCFAQLSFGCFVQFSILQNAYPCAKL